MQVLIVETLINASPEICFDLIRDASLFLQTNEKDFEKFRAEKSHGEIILGETINFESRFFSFVQKLKIKVVELDKPFRLTDEMIEGKFKSFKHLHEFVPKDNKTLIRDTLIWTSPFGILGKIADELLLKKRLRKIVMRRNLLLKQFAENLEKKHQA